MRIFHFKYSAAGIILIAILVGQPYISFAQSPDWSIRDLLRFRIEAGGVPLKISVDKELIHAAMVPPIFYERRTYQPAWTNRQGLLPPIEDLLKAIYKSDSEGLRPDDYHLAKIETILKELDRTPGFWKDPNPHQLVDLDLLLTDAFLIYGSHLLGGRINPGKIHPQWFANRREADLARLLEDALDSNRIEKALAALLPNHAGYVRLRDSLAIYRKLDETGSWPTIPSGSKSQQGDRSDRIPLLRQRLAAEGFMTDPGVGDQRLFDNDLEQALKKFQLQNGLEADGTLGPQTLQALNISAE